MTEPTDKNTDNSAGSADEGSSGRVTPDEVWKWMEANPGLVKKQPPDDEAVTTVRFLGKKQTEAYKRQIKAAEARKKRNK